MAKTNPLDALVTPKPASWAQNFRVPKIPAFRDSLSGKGLPAAVSAHDSAMEKWRAALEKSINERLASSITQVSQTTVVQAVETGTGSSGSSPAAGSAVTSVNGQTGDVLLTTDDIPEGTVNLYSTLATWSRFYDVAGYARNYIAAMQMITVPFQRSMIVVGALTVDGRLTVGGHFASLPSPA
jgi:hypothetical protein